MNARCNKGFVYNNFIILKNDEIEIIEVNLEVERKVYQECEIRIVKGFHQGKIIRIRSEYLIDYFESI